MARVVVLLRAVNVGGRNRVPMAALRSALTEVGVADVSTYIASGNVLCTPPNTVDALRTLVERVIAAQFAVTTTAVVRTGEQVAGARRAFPFEVVDPKLCAVSFLDATPTPAAVRAVAELDFGDDRCAVVGAELHLRYAESVHASKMNGPRLRKALGVDGTARNLLTVDRLVELLDV